MKVRELAARTLGVGKSRIRIVDPKEAASALTREDVRRLVHKGIIRVLPPSGVTRRKEKKRRGRGPGSRKMMLKRKKERWMARIRAIRKLLRELREKGKIDRKTYRELYRRAKGGEIRSKKHLLSLVEGRE